MSLDRRTFLKTGGIAVAVTSSLADSLMGNEPANETAKPKPSLDG